MNSKVKLALKLALVFGLLYFLAHRGFISMKSMRMALTQTGDIVPALLAITITTFMGVVRWQWLLRAQGINLTWLRTLQLTFVGAFFNVALPGAVSGDVIKALYVGNETEGMRARAFGSILFDRVAGLSALVLVSAVAFSLGIATFWNTPLRVGVQFALSAAALSVIAFYTYLFLVRPRHDPLLQLMRRCEARWPASGAVARIYESLRHYGSHRGTVLRVLALSVVIHLLVGFACLRFANALGDHGLPLLGIYVVVPLGLLVTAVPIFPAGVGTGNVAFLYLFGLIGSQRGADIFSLYAMVSILLGAVGGLVYLRFKSTAPVPTPR